MKANQDQFKMSNERIQFYQKEIERLKEIDKQITLKVQHQLNVMDQNERCNGKQK
jgi:hypothetical protein